MNEVAGFPGIGVFGLAGAVGVGMIFAHAGFMKLRHRALMAGVVANYRLLPDALVAPVALALPFFELAIGIALIVGGQRLAVLPAAVLLLGFAGAMAINIRRGRSHIDCGCGDAHLRQPLSWALVGRNLVLAAIVLIRLPPAPAGMVVEVATAMLGGVSVFLLTLLFNAICALAASPLSVKRS